jgi:hypothetical protein
MSEEDEGREGLDALLAAGDPVPADEVNRLSLLHARHDLLEEIMTEKSSLTRASRRLLVPLAAAAAVAALAAGAWAVTNEDDPGRDPAPGFADSSSDNPSTETRPTQASSERSFTALCESGEGEGLKEPVTPEMLEAAGCEIVYNEEDAGPEPERYQKPLRPMLITADGWAPDRVDGYDITWLGPEGQEVRTTWILTAHPEDPWAYEKPGAVQQDRAVELLGVRSRLGEYARGEVRSFALTSGIYRDGTSVYFTSDTMDAEALLEVVESATWVTLDEFDRVVKPAIGG